ncbi:hypothetical protein ECANGB1_1651 [Enterospora canceri]|uniref:Uncharacterized protein n=1 Tax=Enterospora canceri TaxID=1081671 RepID=A0A1Y1S987_9MICR|nr:hypothetical protein ECANGB1_1651 [Enterospora canceri]
MLWIYGVIGFRIVLQQHISDIFIGLENMNQSDLVIKIHNPKMHSVPYSHYIQHNLAARIQHTSKYAINTFLEYAILYDMNQHDDIDLITHCALIYTFIQTNKSDSNYGTKTKTDLLQQLSESIFRGDLNNDTWKEVNNAVFKMCTDPSNKNYIIIDLIDKKMNTISLYSIQLKSIGDFNRKKQKIQYKTPNGIQDIEVINETIYDAITIERIMDDSTILNFNPILILLSYSAYNFREDTLKVEKRILGSFINLTTIPIVYTNKIRIFNHIRNNLINTVPRLNWVIYYEYQMDLIIDWISRGNAEQDESKRKHISMADSIKILMLHFTSYEICAILISNVSIDTSYSDWYLNYKSQKDFVTKDMHESVSGYLFKRCNVIEMENNERNVGFIGALRKKIDYKIEEIIESKIVLEDSSDHYGDMEIVSRKNYIIGIMMLFLIFCMTVLIIVLNYIYGKESRVKRIN